MKRSCFTALILTTLLLAFPARADYGNYCASQAWGFTCLITEPIVNQENMSPVVEIEPDDSVQIDAGGCVQTGGSGSTWKRYVDPAGPNSDKLYYGTIHIPGQENYQLGYEARISALLGQIIKVPNFPVGTDMHIKLGYKDDGYGDNGYWRHDDGTGNQCKDSKNAWILVTVTHHGPSGTLPPPLAMDLVSTSGGPLVYDSNPLPLNPTWYWNATNSGKAVEPQKECAPTRSDFFSSCSNLIPTANTYNTPSNIDINGQSIPICNGSRPWRINGHLNWKPVTYTGIINFVNHDHGPSGDDDYNWSLVPGEIGNELPYAGMTDGNHGNLHLEFDSDETVDRFGSVWWKKFRAAVDEGDNSDDNYWVVQRMVNGRYAIVIGVLGLDLVQHPAGSTAEEVFDFFQGGSDLVDDVHAEIHPVQLMAIRTETSEGIFIHDDKWAIFARNWGNEGECGKDQVGLSLNRLAIDLPWQSGATGYTITGNDFHASGQDVEGPWVSSIQGKSVRLEFRLPDPMVQGLIDGEISIRWNWDRPPTPDLVVRPAETTVVGSFPEDGADLFNECLLNDMSAQEKQDFFAALPPRSPEATDTMDPTPSLELDNPPPPPSEPPSLLSFPDHRKVERDQAKLEAMKTALKSRLSEKVARAVQCVTPTETLKPPVVTDLQLREPSAEVDSGSALQCSVEVKNAGRIDADQAQVLMLLPVGVSIKDFGVRGTYFDPDDEKDYVTCDESPSIPGTSGGTQSYVTCNVGHLPANESAVLKVSATKPLEKNACAAFTWSNTPDQNLNDNYVTMHAGEDHGLPEARTQANVGVLTAAAGFLDTGFRFRCSAEIRNENDDVAVDARALMLLPAGARFISASSNCVKGVNAPSSASPGFVRCDLGQMAPGPSKIIEVVATRPPNSTAGNCAAFAWSNTPDPESQNNFALSNPADNGR